VEGIPLGPWLDALNERICRHIGRDARNLQIGHAYLMDGDKPIATFARFARVVQDDIIPLLEEYCYEDHTILERILGKALIDASSQRVQHDLFDPDRQEKLIDALISECPEITGTKQAMESEAEKEADAAEDNLADEITEDE
jgi:5-methylcytosine-specific restriction protein B